MSRPDVHPQPCRVAVACGSRLGEGPVWDHRDGTLLWVDIAGQSVWRWRPGGEARRIDTAEPVGFVALTADAERVIAGFPGGLVRLDLRDGRSEPVVALSPEQPGNRINDGHVGPDGSLYFGTLHREEREATGCFWRYDGRALTSFGGPFVVTNGPAVSPDGRHLYTSDSKGAVVYVHDLDASGRPGEGRPLIRFEPGWGHPDGIAVDAEGHLWIAHWGDSRVTRFTPDGEAERIVPVPTAQVTKCAFGGPDLTTLYITTAAQGRDPHIDPMAGHLFEVETGIRGLPANIARF